MKILYIAFACDPYAGSEAQCGWAWPNSMRKYANVSVLTRKQNKTNIEKYMYDHNINNIKVYYYDVPDAINVYYKSGKFYSAYYAAWQKTSYKFIRGLNEREKFDYIHQITLGDFRLISPSYKLDVKFIFGPVGGAQLTPESLSVYANEDLKTEKVREKINEFIGNWPPYRKAINKAHLVFAANRETQNYLDKVLKRRKKSLLLTENGIDVEKVPKIEAKKERQYVSLMWAGRMVPRKGLKFLIDVMKEVKTKIPYKIMLVGEGPEKNDLEQYVLEAGLEDKIIFKGKIPYTQMKEMYLNSDIFVFPSLRETTGTVLFEAMAYALPVITFEQNGADLLIDDTCGRKINIKSPISEIKANFATAIEELVEHAELRNVLGDNARKRIIDDYLWEAKCRNFYELYIKGEKVQ